jgi:hypothetical protein
MLVEPTVACPYCGGPARAEWVDETQVDGFCCAACGAYQVHPDLLASMDYYPVNQTGWLPGDVTGLEPAMPGHGEAARSGLEPALSSGLRPRCRPRPA